jgi:hypothetical protein
MSIPTQTKKKVMTRKKKASGFRIRMNFNRIFTGRFTHHTDVAERLPSWSRSLSTAFSSWRNANHLLSICTSLVLMEFFRREDGY